MRGLLISHENGISYVMDNKGCFHRVKGISHKPVGSEVEFNTPITLNRKIALIAATFLIFTFSGLYAYLFRIDAYYLAVDINPSFELAFNNMDRVKSVRAVNEDGEKFLAGVRIKGSAQEALKTIVAAAVSQGYGLSPADQEASIQLTVIAQNEKTTSLAAAKINEVLHSMAELPAVDVDISDLKLRDEAQAKGVSPGKLKRAEELYRVDQSKSLEELLVMPMSELNEQLHSQTDNKNNKVNTVENKSFNNDKEQESKDNTSKKLEKESEKEAKQLSKEQKKQTENNGNQGQSKKDDSRGKHDKNDNNKN